MTPEQIKNLIKRLKSDVDFAIESNEPVDIGSWRGEHGVLITVNEAKYIVELLTNNLNQ